MDEKTTTQGRYLRTMLREDVYDRLETYAKTFTNGLGKWDFGIAIERLMDMAELDEHFKVIDSRLMTLETQLATKGVEEDKEVQEDNPYGLLGKRNKKNGKD